MSEWPEVFDDLYMNTLPVSYLETLTIEFSNGRVWEIDIQDHEAEQSQSITDKVLDAFQEYHEEISSVSFKIDIDRLKDDIKKSSKDIF